MGGTYLQKLYIVGLFRVLYAQPAFALADEQKAAEKRPSRFITQSKRTLELRRAAAFRPCGNELATHFRVYARLTPR